MLFSPASEAATYWSNLGILGGVACIIVALIPACSRNMKSKRRS